MINKKKLIKSKGKWVVASYAAIAIGLLNVADVHAETEETPVNLEMVVPIEEMEHSITEVGADLPSESITPVAVPFTVLESEVESTPDVNHLLNVEASASDVETNDFTADKAVDGNDTTRWATHQNVNTPALMLTLPQVTHIERVEMKWDPRMKDDAPDANINEWRLSYQASDQDTEWKIAHTRTGMPLIDESINLEHAIDAKRLKLEVTDYESGRLNWRNVGLQEMKAYSNAIESTPDVNHLLNATATASNHEANTTFTGDKAVDGQESTRWATDVGSAARSLTLALAKDTHLERIEIDWDKRANTGLGIEQDPNVRAWKLYYATSAAQNVEESTRNWQLLHTRQSGEPILEEVVQLDTPVNARYLKLVVEEFTAGQIQWQNVGIREIRAFSNREDSQRMSRLGQVEHVTLNETATQIVMPELPGEVTLIGSNKLGVIDLTGKVFQPLTQQQVKIMLQQKLGNESFTKEFEIQVNGRYENEGVGEKPTVVPVVQQWHGVEGKTNITANTVTVADADNFADIAQMYREDLVSRGLTLQEGTAEASQRIEFKKVTDRGYGKEGYGIQLNNGAIVIEAATSTGAFYATRTLLQMGESNLQNGEMRDFPSFEHRGFLLDTGRKFVPYHTVVDIMKNMAYYKMNDLQLHLNDNYIFLKEHIKNKNLTPEQELEYVLNNATTGFRVETDIIGENGVALTSADHYSKEEIQSLISIAKSLSINLVPEIDTPGHALSFVKVRPDLMYRGQLSTNKHNVERVAMLDLSNKYDETLVFVKSVYEKLFFAEDAPMKDVTTIHIGTDEYYGNAEDYRRYTNDMLQYIKSKGRTPRFWASLSAKDGNTPVDVTGTEMQIWSIDWQRPELALALGAKIINITDSPTYSVPSGSGNIGAYGDYSNYIQQYNSWTPNDFRTGRGQLFASSHPQILGGAHALWNDNIDLHDTGITSYDMFKRFFKTMTVTAEKTWGSSRAPQTYNERMTVPDALRYAPGTNPEYQIGESQLFDISAQTLDQYATEDVATNEQGIVFGADSVIETNAEAVGPDAVLTIDVTLTGEGEQGFSTDGVNAIYLSDQDGKVAYKFEQYYIQFNKSLERNHRYKLTFVTRELGTDLYVDDEKVERIAQPAHPQLAHTSFVMPLGYIFGFQGTLHRAQLSKSPYINPNIVDRSEIETITASSQQSPNDRVENAFDGNPQTMWHSHWTNKDNEYTLDVTLKEPTLLKGLSYLPRQAGGANGIITQYEIYANVNDVMTKVAEGTWENNANEKSVQFAPVTTRQLQLKVLAGVNGFASAAEITLLKAKQSSEEETPDRTTEAHTYTEPTTNISVEFPAGELSSINGIRVIVVPSEQSEQVPAITGKDHVLYDIEAIDETGMDVDTTRSAIVRIPIPANKYVEKVLFLPENEAVRELAFTVASNHVVFTAPHFSHYALVFRAQATPADDGTVELDARFRSEQSISEQAVNEALTSPDYLNREYKVFPTPQKVTYGNTLVRLDKGVNLVLGEGLDIYTRNRLKATLQTNHVSYETTDSNADNAVNVLLGVYGSDSLAQQHQANANIDATLYNKIDAYSIVIKDNVISIVGKDTDAVFHGVTTLKHMLNESAVPVLREVTVEDYANIRNRGFIEGYYGNPWSNADRAELMRYGGDLKLTQYFFAPKDDVYHNSQWRDLYPEDKLAEIRELARVGNENKTRYVWTLHPFMHRRVRFDTTETYQEDLQIIKNKFTQLLDAGVREFGILADDASLPVGGYDSYNRLMKDLTDWLGEKQAQYSGLKKDMIFVPADYMGSGTSNELRSLNANLPETSHLTLTGGRIWGEVSQQFLSNLQRNLTQNGATYRPVQLWINWPCTDNSKDHLILGGGEKFLHPNIDPSLVAGIMLNPMQQSEPSKIALFSAAEYSWNVWKSEEYAKKVNDIAFNFAETGKFTDTATAEAFRELGKHMINQNMDNRVVKLEESVELAPKLTAFMTKLKAGEDVTAEREELRAEFKKLKDAAELYKQSGNERMRTQIMYWLDNTIDQMNALDALLTATEYVGTTDASALWNHYYRGLSLYNQSKTHKFHYVNEYRHAELGVQHIRPFITGTLEFLANQIEKELNPERIVMNFISNRTGAEGNLNLVEDGDLATEIIFKNPATIATGDYVGLVFNRAINVNQLGFAMGRNGNLNDTFTNAELQYMNEAGEWVVIEGHSFQGNEPLIHLQDLNLMAKGIRLISTSDKANTWLGIREIAVNRPLQQDNGELRPTVTHSDTLIYKLNTSATQITDGRDNTEAMLASSDTGESRDTTPAGAWVQLNLDAPVNITKVRLVQGQRDKLVQGVIEYSTDGTTWTPLESLTGQQTKEITTNITARYIRVRNEQTVPVWWRIADFSIEARIGTTELTDTNADALRETKVFTDLGRYEMELPANATLEAGQYIGLSLDRLHELANVTFTGEVNPQLNLYYSPNLVEWYQLDQLATVTNARYIRLVNPTKVAQTIGATAMIAETKEVQPTVLESTTMGINQYYGNGDVRRLNNLAELFDGVYNNMVTFSDYPRQDGNIVLKLGTERSISSIRAYIQDGTQNYLRDGKIQVSADGQTWTDVVVVGDGAENERRDDSLTDGWTHDAQRPGNRYIEGTLATPVTANYLRVLFTADYNHRFVGFSEIVINNGEFVKEVNDPTVTTTARENHQNVATQIVDGNVLTSYQADAASGELMYHLSEKTQANHIRIISNVPTGATVKVFARVVKKSDQPELHATDVPTTWIELGTLSDSFQTFAIRQDISHLLDVKLTWENGQPEVYELATFRGDVDPITMEAQTHTESTTGISVTFPAGERVAIKGIKASEIDAEQSKQKPELKDTEHVLYEIEAIDAEGAEVGITMPVTVQIPANRKVTKVLRFAEDGMVTELSFDQENNQVVFQVTQLDQYALVFEKVAEQPKDPKDEEIPTPKPEEPKGEETLTPKPEEPKGEETPTPKPEAPKGEETPTPKPEAPKDNNTPMPPSDSNNQMPDKAPQDKPSTDKEMKQDGATSIADTAGEQLPQTGESPAFAIFSSAALSILAGVGIVAKRREE